MPNPGQYPYPREWRKERDNEGGGWNIVGKTPGTRVNVQVAWCLTEDNADYVLTACNLWAATEARKPAPRRRTEGSYNLHPGGRSGGDHP